MISHLARSPLAHRRTHSTPSGCSLEDVAAGPGLAGGVTSPLADVPENEEVRCPRRLASSHALTNTPAENCPSASLFSPPLLLVTGVRGNLPKNRDWIRLQQTIRSLFKTRRVALQPGELAALHERIRALSGSKAGPFIYDSYKRELEVCFTALRHKLCQQPRDQLLAALADEWDNLFTHVLPTLDLILYVVKGKGSESIRQTFLVTFRDVVVTKLDLDDLLSLNKDAVLESIRHMILILYNVSDSYPPTKTKLKLESLLARLVSPFLGFQGLYLQGHPEPVIKSSEPEIAARRKSADGVPLPRKLSRPMSSQPRQIETLHELFLTALRKQPDF